MQRGAEPRRVQHKDERPQRKLIGKVAPRRQVKRRRAGPRHPAHRERLQRFKREHGVQQRRGRRHWRWHVVKHLLQRRAVGQVALNRAKHNEPINEQRRHIANANGAEVRSVRELHRKRTTAAR